MLTIDTHSHWVPAPYEDALQTADPAMAAYVKAVPALRDLDERLRQMDAAAIDISVLSVIPARFTDHDARVRAMADANDALLDAAERHAGRFQVAVSLPLPDVADALAELERVAVHPHARALFLPTASTPATIDDARLEPLYRRVAALGWPVMTHPIGEDLAPCWRDWDLLSKLALPISTSLGVARLVASGLLDRVPGLDVVVPHLGGTLPYLVQRFDDFGNGDAAHSLAYYLRNRLYLDTCSFHPPAFTCAATTAGVDRLVLGSDAPVRGALTRATDHVIAMCPDPTEQALVLGGTAQRWFGPDRGGSPTASRTH